MAWHFMNRWDRRRFPEIYTESSKQRIHCPYCHEKDETVLNTVGYWRFECSECKKRFVFMSNGKKKKSFETEEFDLTLDVLSYQDKRLLRGDIEYNEAVDQERLKDDLADPSAYIIVSKDPEPKVTRALKTGISVGLAKARRALKEIKWKNIKLVINKKEKATIGFKDMLVEIIKCKECGAALQPPFEKCEACGYFHIVKLPRRMRKRWAKKK